MGARPQPRELEGKRALVTGAARGFGRAVAHLLAGAGADLAVADLGSLRGRSPYPMAGREELDRTVAELRTYGVQAHALEADVTRAEDCERIASEAIGMLGGIDILVANAGGPPAGDFEHTTIDQYLEAFKLNCLSSIAMCYEVVPEMRAQKWGRVVAITSLAVRQPMAGLILSNTARAGLTGFLKTLAREVAADGVTVNSLLPGLHETERLTSLHGAGSLDDLAASVPAHVLGQPGDFGEIAAFLCSEAARFVTGTATPIDGGAYAGLL
jgi:3-oxoacyl-[acyl-carrier protein] reductase